MSFLDDLKKKGQNLVQNVQNAGNAAYNGVKTLYDTARNGGKNTNQQQMQQQNNALTRQQQPAINQQETDWLAEYDKYRAEEMASADAAAVGTVKQPEAGVNAGNRAAEMSGAVPDSRWKAELDGIMGKILNREKFEYDMNGDAMYQQYADMYKNQANLGMQNAMAQAAAMTGGYGSSYGQMVGQQAYASQMQGLNEVGMDLYDRAVQRYIAEGDQMYQQYEMLADREAQDYNRAIDERNFEYQAGRDAVADSQWDKQMEYNYAALDQDDKHFYDGLDHDVKMQDDAQDFTKSENALDRAHDVNMQDDAQEYNTSEREASQEYNTSEREASEAHDIKMQDDSQAYGKEMQEDSQAHESDMYDKEFENMYGEDGYMTNKDKQEQDNWQDQFDREGDQWDKLYGEGGLYNPEPTPTTATYEGGGTLGGQDVPYELSDIAGLTTTDTSLFDSSGKLKTITMSSYQKNDNASDSKYANEVTWNIDGKEVTLQAGVNPYTGTKNPDCANGTFDNGYQPDNVTGYYNGNKQYGHLAKTGLEDVVNGVKTPVYKDGKGEMWIWDAANNEYMTYKKSTPSQNTNGNSLGDTSQNISDSTSSDNPFYDAALKEYVNAISESLDWDEFLSGINFNFKK